MMQKEVERKKAEFNDPFLKDTGIRILNFNTCLLQKKTFVLVRAFNSVQVDVKQTYQEKMKRQILAFDPNMHQSTIKELINDPLVE